MAYLDRLHARSRLRLYRYASRRGRWASGCSKFAEWCVAPFFVYPPPLPLSFLPYRSDELFSPPPTSHRNTHPNPALINPAPTTALRARRGRCTDRARLPLRRRQWWRQRRSRSLERVGARRSFFLSCPFLVCGPFGPFRLGAGAHPRASERGHRPAQIRRLGEGDRGGRMGECEDGHKRSDGGD